MYRDLGTMATIGRHDAIAEFPIGIRLAGLLGWFAMAAAVGASLRWLDIRSRLLPPARPPQGSSARIREAA